MSDQFESQLAELEGDIDEMIGEKIGWVEPDRLRCKDIKAVITRYRQLSGKGNKQVEPTEFIGGECPECKKKALAVVETINGRKIPDGTAYCVCCKTVWGESRLSEHRDKLNEYKLKGE